MPPPARPAAQPGTTAPQGPPPRRNEIDPQAEFSNLRDRYSKRETKKINLLLVGEHGTGKTFNIAKHAPGPVHIDSFDSGGTISAEDFIASGRCIVDTTFEDDVITNPKAYRAWEREFQRRYAGGYFNHIGTYVLDSFTGYAAALMGAILGANGRTPRGQQIDLGKDPDIVPELQDYNVQQKTIARDLGMIAGLPCHTVIIGHLNISQDDTTKKLVAAVLMDGRKFPQLLPTLFTEVYFADVLPGQGGLTYVYQTAPKGIFKARSRLSKGRILQDVEPQNLAAILKKAGYPYEDKPLYK